MNSIPAANSISSEISAVINNIDADIDITNCDREQIHIPNLIQPHGVLLAVSADKYQILQVSLNTTQMLGVEPEQLLNKPLHELLGEEQVAAIQGCLTENFDNVNPIPIEIVTEQKSRFFNGIVHCQDKIIVVELEPRQREQTRDFFDFYIFQ